MKALLVLAGLTTITSAQFLFQVPSQFEGILQTTMTLINNCKQKTGAQEDVQQLMSTLTVPTSPEGKCMVACVFSTVGLMKNGQVDTAAVKNFVETMFPGIPKTFKDIADMIITKCGSSGAQTQEECENAAAYVACAKKTFFEDMK